MTIMLVALGSLLAGLCLGTALAMPNRRLPTAKTSNLVAHAERELRLCRPAESADRIYAKMIEDDVIALIKVLAAQRHSAMTLHLFNRLVKFKVLSPITASPSEWEDMSTMWGGPMWQSKRDPSYFSKDGGNTWYCLNEI